MPGVPLTKASPIPLRARYMTSTGSDSAAVPGICEWRVSYSLHGIEARKGKRTRNSPCCTDGGQSNEFERIDLVVQQEAVRRSTTNSKVRQH